MRVAALYDVHGNLPALEAVLAEVAALGVDAVVCHGSPRSDEEILTRATPDGAVGEALAGVPAGVVVCGHTHVQFDRLIGGVRLVNAGSIGLPYEGDADARWARLGPAVELRRTAYDVERGAAAAEASGFPQREMIARKLRTPSSAEEATAFFEGRRGA